MILGIAEGYFRILYDADCGCLDSQLPWLRMDALNLNIIWAYIPIARAAVPGSSRWAWIVGSLNIPISWGWAAGDVSLIGKSLFSSSRIEAMLTAFNEQLTFKLESLR